MQAEHAQARERVLGVSQRRLFQEWQLYSWAAPP